MSRIKLKQILSNMQYNSATQQLYVSGSGNPTFIVSGSMLIAPLSGSDSGSFTIQGFNTFGDTGSASTVDLGDF